MFKHLLGAAAALCLTAGAQAATDYPSGYTKCAQNTGATCSFSGTRQVALGKSGSFVYATFSNGAVCSSSNFPSNSYTSSAWCSYSGSTTSSSSSSAPSSSSSSKSSSSSSSKSSASTTSSSSSSKSSSSTSSSNGNNPVPGWTGPVNVCEPGALIHGTTIDCGGKSIGLSCNGDSETQPAVLTLINATVKNVTIKAGGGADGIHCGWGSLGSGLGTNVQGGTCNLTNVTWAEVCEDAASIGNGQVGTTMNINGGSATDADDKVFQHNGINATLNVTNFTTYGSIGKLSRSCGDCTGNGGPRYFNINGVTLNKVSSAVIGVNGNYGDKATLRNIKIKGYKSGSPKVCVEYKGVQKGSGSSSTVGEKWNTSACNVSTSDVTSF
ncbi:MAG: pectate lyase [Rhodocyclaceae bacterium]